jgi:hypothetical protein
MRVRVPTAEEAKLNLPPTKPNIPKVQAAFDAWGHAQMQRRGLMRADIEQQSPSDDPCANSPESGYRGLENQLYRVEIHKGGTAWNGSRPRPGDRQADLTPAASGQRASVDANQVPAR